MSEKEIIEGTADAVAKHLPKTTSSIDTVLSSIVNLFDVLLAPVQAIKMLKDSVLEDFGNNLKAKSSSIPKEYMKDKLELNIVGPTLEALKYTFLEDDLREMFENLLVSSIDKREDVFPSFVDIIRQLSSDEAKLLKYFSHNGKSYPLIDLQVNFKQDGGFITPLYNFTNIGFGVVEKPKLINAYLYDLSRFGIIEILDGVFIKNESLYKDIESHPYISNFKLANQYADGEYEFKRKKFIVTDFGEAFIKSCVTDKEELL